MILAGDVGGTKTHLAIFRPKGRAFIPVAERRVLSRHYPGLVAIVRETVASHRGRITAACFGVAGPILNGRCEATNLPWTVDADALRRTLGLRAVGLINDLEALAYGIEAVPRGRLAALNAGTPRPHGAIAVIAAGTGLGEAALVWDGERYHAAPSEGGHTDFAPRNEMEVELLRYLQRRFGHVSYERIVSGPGKISVYEFVKARERAKEPAWLKQRLAAGDPSAVISDIAMERAWQPCVKALDLFVSIYGAEAGNLALKVLATGGVYLGGGIAPAILPALKDGTFMKAFKDKGRLSPLLSRMPVRVILDGRAALYGAARYAMGLNR